MDVAMLREKKNDPMQLVNVHMRKNPLCFFLSSR